MCFLLLILSLLGPMTSADASDDFGHAHNRPPGPTDWQSHWREGGYDAVTSLYVLFQLHQTPIGYDELVSESRLVGNCSFGTLLAIATERGADAVLRKCTANELDRISLPAIIHVDVERDSSKGEFVVLINRTRNSWMTVNGGTGTLGELKSSDLLRQWSGYVMSIRRPQVSWPVIVTAMVTGGFLGRVFGSRILQRPTHKQ